MINMPADYKAAILASTINDRITGSLLLSNGDTIEIACDNVQQGSCYISEQCTAKTDFAPGGTVAGEMGISLLLGEDPALLNSAAITLAYEIETTAGWRQVPLFAGCVDEAIRQSEYINLVAYDDMLLLDLPLEGSVSGASPYGIINWICTQCGLTLATPEAAFSAFANGSLGLTLPEKSKIKTYRDLLGWVCQSLGCFARVSRSVRGRLDICPMWSTAVLDMSRDVRTSTKISDTWQKVTRVTMKVSGTTYTAGVDGTEIILAENPLYSLLLPATIGLALENLLAKLTTAEFAPGTVALWGDPSLQAGDMVNLIVDPTTYPQSVENKIPMLITSQTWRFRGKHSITSAGKSSLTRGDYSQLAKAVDDATDTASAAVVSSQQIYTSLTERIDTVEASLQVTSDAITGKISQSVYEAWQTEIQNNLDNGLTEVSEETRIYIDEKTSQLQQTVDSITAEFSQRYGGGFNLIPNSSGLNGVNGWTRTGTASTDSTSTDVKSNTVSGSCFVIGNGTLQKTLSLSPGQYTLTLRLKKAGSSAASITIDNSGEQLIVYNSPTAAAWVDYVYTFSAAGNAITLVLNSSGNSLYVADLMLTAGDERQRWSPAPNEIYTENTIIDGQGVTVKNSESDSRTVMTNNEFSGYYRDTLVFSVNKDMTSLQKAAISDDLTIGKIKIISDTANNATHIAFLD